MKQLKQLNLLIIVTDLTLGGIQNYVRASAKLLQQMHHNVYIIAINDAHLLQGIDVLSLKKVPSYHKPFFIKRFIKTHYIDGVLDHRTKLNLLKQKVYDVLLKNTPKIQFVHSANCEMYFYKSKSLTKWAYKNTDLFIGVSKFIKQLVQQQVGAPCEVLYHFFEENKVSMPPQLYVRKDLLFVGRFEDEVKDLKFLLSAYLQSGLYKKQVKFHFVGAGNDKTLIEEFAKEHNLEEYVLLHAATTNLTTFYQRAKVVVLASNFEGFPLVLMEALHNGAPVITTVFNPSVYELVTHKYNGLIVDKDLNNFTNALLNVYDNQHLYATLLSNNENEDERFSKKVAQQKWQIVLTQLLKNRSA